MIFTIAVLPCHPTELQAVHEFVIMPSLGHVDTPGVCIGLQPSACAVQEGREELMVQACLPRVQVVCFSFFFQLVPFSLFVPQQLHIKCGRMQSAIVGRRERLKSQKF